MYNQELLNDLYRYLTSVFKGCARGLKPDALNSWGRLSEDFKSFGHARDELNN